MLNGRIGEVRSTTSLDFFRRWFSFATTHFMTSFESNFFVYSNITTSNLKGRPQSRSARTCLLFGWRHDHNFALHSVNGIQTTNRKLIFVLTFFLFSKQKPMQTCVESGWIWIVCHTKRTIWWIIWILVFFVLLSSTRLHLLASECSPQSRQIINLLPCRRSYTEHAFVLFAQQNWPTRLILKLIWKYSMDISDIQFDDDYDDHCPSSALCCYSLNQTERSSRWDRWKSDELMARLMFFHGDIRFIGGNRVTNKSSKCSDKNIIWIWTYKIMLWNLLGTRTNTKNIHCLWIEWT